MLIIDESEIPTLENAEISANCGGITIRDKRGKPAALAIVDEAGNVLESGEAVSKAAWMLMLLARRNFLEGRGHVRVSRA